LFKLAWVFLLSLFISGCVGFHIGAGGGLIEKNEPSQTGALSVGLNFDIGEKVSLDLGLLGPVFFGQNVIVPTDTLLTKDFARTLAGLRINYYFNPSFAIGGFIGSAVRDPLLVNTNKIENSKTFKDPTSSTYGISFRVEKDIYAKLSNVFWGKNIISIGLDIGTYWISPLKDEILVFDDVNYELNFEEKTFYSAIIFMKFAIGYGLMEH